jgi:hypothetical protein
VAFVRVNYTNNPIVAEFGEQIEPSVRWRMLPEIHEMTAQMDIEAENKGSGPDHYMEIL